MPSNSAEYQRQYRARKKGQQPGHPSPAVEVTKDEVASVEDNADRRAGLPRTNYYGDYTQIIPAMTQHARDKILSHPAIHTKRRDS